MTSLNFPTLRQLRRVDGSSSDFTDKLYDILCGPGYVECEKNFAQDDAVWLADYLDNALGYIDPSSPASRKCLSALRKVCGTREILPASYTLQSQHLGVDSTSSTFEGSRDVCEGTLGGSRVRIKRVRVTTGDVRNPAAKTFYEEVVTWKHLTHPNVLPFVGITIEPLQLISSWPSGGDLLEHIRRYPSTDRLELLCGVTEGLSYLHSRSLVHGDLKGSNIIVDNSGHVRIADFGLAEISRNPSFGRSASCQDGLSPRWAAPEVWNKGEYSEKADIFSFAMVTIEILTGTVPFCDRSYFDAMFAIAQGERPQRPKHPRVTGAVWELVQRCWDDNPCSRPEASEVSQILLSSNLPVWKQLISPSLSVGERIGLIMTVFSDRDEAKVIIGSLSVEDAQAFVDTIHEVLEGSDNLPSKIRRRCVRSLYTTCGRGAKLPKSLSIPLCCNPADTPRYSGVFADVWKGSHDGLEVAAKALRVYRTSDFDEIRKRFCKEVIAWRALRHPNVLPLLGMTMEDRRFVMVSEWMKNGNIIDFLKNKGADRLELVVGVTRGLVYMHDQGIVHGNLDGHNIMIDDDGCAVVAGFGLITLVPGQSTFLSSCMDAGAVQWMSPELLNPEKFGLSGIQQTKESDCYALGMVAYEILSGCAPFGTNGHFAILRKVVDGEHPERPQGDAGKLFTDEIWSMLDCCWEAEPRVRASARDMLRCLEGNSPTVEGDNDAVSSDSFYHELDDVGDGSETRPLNPPFNSSPIASRPLVSGRFPTSPQAGNLAVGWAKGWSAYITWNVFGTVTRYFRHFW